MSYKMNLTSLSLSWSTSKGQDTHGYNIARLDDRSTGKRFKCMGGGYDMVGTVFGDWLESGYQSRLLDIGSHAGAISTPQDGYVVPERTPETLYGMTLYRDTASQTCGRIALDGGCGIESMIRIAEAIGLRVQRVGDKKGRTTGFIVEDITLRVYE